MTYPKCAMELVWLNWELQKDTVDIILFFVILGKRQSVWMQYELMLIGLVLAKHE
jgi:hypothetical protein